MEHKVNRIIRLLQLICIQADKKKGKNIMKDIRLFDIDGIHMIGNFDNGAVIGLDNDGLNYIKKGEQNICAQKKEEIDNAMQEMGFLDEIEKKIDSVYLHVTDACNLHCIGCYSFIDNRNLLNNLSTNQMKRILDSLKKVGVQKIVISGGEPFLRSDLKELCRYAKENCQFEFLTVITNGTLDIETYYPVIPYINQLNVSVDGYDENSRFIRDNGIMPKVLNTILKLRDMVEINMIITLHKKNMKYMKEYNILSQKLGVRFSFSIFTADEKNYLFKEYILNDRDLIQIEKNLMELNISAAIEDIPIGGELINCRSRCEAGNKLISIDARGDIYPCHMLHKQELLLGNILEENIEDIVFTSNNMFQNLHVDDFKECTDCKYKYLCGGGCRGRSYLRYGNLEQKDTYCAMIYHYYQDLMNEVKKNLGEVL